ncbi:phosphopantetheine-binding protein [Rhodococcus sp. ACS1]|jgi:acyl carrier protein|uniref:Acyl carrier protein n=1 Tax=Rhodococcus koreensis TaxID=99653 RepID=A0A1H5EX01_9NOCA|nr:MULTISPECIES: phosphopantetheine-binding protein [Rhodococcus]PBC40202.1 phosphopantetheine-binding protein [Rhodococcus sp. ACS1]SEB32016.1 acyl carrier protein [Rhodococcus koreensis]SED95488.1 acyl carrier protein [Rhodococcus koreensis]
MNAESIDSKVLHALRDIAPEIEDEEVSPDVPLRDQVDLDSMDWLNFLVRLHAVFDVDIPESDYATLVTVEDIVEYISSHTHA